MYREVTQDVEVEVTPRYVVENSDPEKQYFFFAYHVTITNRSRSPKRLVSRKWIIVDGKGHVEKVEGPGVVGETPRLEPGQSYSYTSACPLSTPTGNMRGTYQMADDAGEVLDVRIPLFFLREMPSPELNVH